jgi:hypothetical protein
MKHTLLVQLDALLDTRLPSIAKLDPAAAVTLVKSEAYYRRQIDDFETLTGLTKAQTDEAYQARDVETLKGSRLTPMNVFVDTWVRKLEAEARDTPHVEDVEVHINIAPYDLDVEEQEVLLTTIMARIGVEAKAKIVSIPLQELTPALCKSTYTGLVLYDFREWMEFHALAFQSTPIPRLVVTAPALFRDRIPDPSEVQVEGMPFISPFSVIGVLFSEMISLELVPAELYSIIRL